MKIYRLSEIEAWRYPYVFEGDTGVPSDSGIYFEAIKMKDGTIYFGSNHYVIVRRYSLTANPEEIESFGFLEADGVYTVKSDHPIEYMKGHKYNLPSRFK